MSVNMNASGAEGIRELLNILQGQGDDMPGDMDGPDGGPAGVLIGMDGPDGGDEMGPDGAPDMHGGDEEPMKKPMLGKGPEMDEEFANEPQPQMQGVDAVTPTGDDLSSKGGNEMPKAAGGGNPYTQPMAENLRGKLTALYHEIKTR
jgi:hypothetical protein